MSNFIYDIQLGFLAFPLVALLLAGTLCALSVPPLRRYLNLEDLRGLHLHPVFLMRSFTDRVSVTSGPQRSG